LGRVHVGNIWQSYVNPFTLENGAEQLKPFFSNVTLSRYKDSLSVTEIEPIMAYLRSSMRAAELSEDELVKVQANLENKLKEEGRIVIKKDPGLFEAIK
jgi:hypothetical protein